MTTGKRPTVSGAADAAAIYLSELFAEFGRDVEQRRQRWRRPHRVAGAEMHRRIGRVAAPEQFYERALTDSGLAADEQHAAFSKSRSAGMSAELFEQRLTFQQQFAAHWCQRC